MTPTSGFNLGPYQIISRLGAGGMGEVYLAQDTRLGRKVALKLLPEKCTQDEDRVRRFKQEARAASALNHPNIVTIYEIGQVDDTHFIATEFIDGQTLRQQMVNGKLTLNAALELAIQIAAALAAAHEAKIVHRDIKPENLMVRRDGLIKVLDFGLAKLTEQRANAPDSHVPTQVKVETDPGTIMGTTQYMSPEQARGQEIDTRSDIFSLGVVLYEMMVGRAPFEGPSASDVIAAILTKEPPPLLSSAPEAPAELRRIVAKALRKEREERYQGIKDLLVDLKSLKQELELEARAAQRESGDEKRDAGGKERAVTAAPAAQTGEMGVVRRASSADYLLSQVKGHPRGALLALMMLLLVGAGIAFGLWQLIGRQPAIPFQTLQPTRLTATGRAEGPAISPDGKYMAYVVNDGSLGGQESLWLRQVATGSVTQIAPLAEVRYSRLTFSPDSNYLYYRQSASSGGQAAIYRSPSLGGGYATKLIDGVIFFVLSPDGKRLALMRGSSIEGENALVVVNVDGTGEQKLVSLKSPEYIVPMAWSPDGQTIACANWYPRLSLATKIVAVQVADGARKPISAQDWFRVGFGAAWLPDSSGLIFTSTGTSSGQDANTPSQIWYLSYPGGEARMLTNDLTNYDGVSLTADASALVTTQSESAYNLWVMPQGDASRARPLTTGKQAISGLAWTTKGKIVYASNASGGERSWNIWMMEPDGSASRRLTAADSEYRGVTVSPDDRYLVFTSSTTGLYSIWRMDFDGGNLKQLARNYGNFLQCSPDGRWVIYHTDREDYGLWKVAIDGGEPVQITDQYLWAATISPDGKQVAANYRTQSREPYRIAILPFEGGPLTRVFDYPGNAGRRLRWTPDGRALTYSETREGVTNLWSLPLNGGPPTQLTDFKDSHINSFAWSRDGRQLAFTRGVANSDVVLIRNFR